MHIVTLMMMPPAYSHVIHRNTLLHSVKFDIIQS
jgi:hypothetical protein